MGISDATHAEYGTVGTPVITVLSCSLSDREIVVDLEPTSLLARLHGASRVVERASCNYGLAADLRHLAAVEGMRVAATDDTGEVRAVERADHPFFVATLYQPQLSSTRSRPHPVFVELLRVATERQASERQGR